MALTPCARCSLRSLKSPPPLGSTITNEVFSWGNYRSVLAREKCAANVTLQALAELWHITYKMNIPANVPWV